MATLRWVTVAPGATSLVTSCSSSASDVIRNRRIDSSSAARTPGSSSSSAARMASRGTVMSSLSTPSKRAENSEIASTPRARTASMIGCT